MLRLVLSIILVIAFAGASTASVMHGLTHGASHADQHDAMVDDMPVESANAAIAGCCKSSGGVGSTLCFGDLVTANWVLVITPAKGLENYSLHLGKHTAGTLLDVPTGPPKG